MRQKLHIFGVGYPATVSCPCNRSR